MKKLNILYYLLIVGLISCKSEVENKDDLILKKSDSLFNESFSIISERFSWLNVDSINTSYSNIELPNDKLIFAKNLNTYTKNKILEVERIIKLSKEKEQEQAILEEKKVQYEWEKSKAGIIQKKHPNWSKEDCQKLADNKIWIGMSLDMLIYKRGRPNNANPSNYGSGTQWQWCWDDYTPSCFYGKNDEIITSYN